MKSNSRLGRGLDALIRRDSEVQDRSVIDIAKVHPLDSIAKIPVGRIKTNKYQPRKEFLREPLEELKKSISENGLVQPITVRQTDDGQYELISGERRLRAVTELGIGEIAAYVIKIESDTQLLELALTENLQREDLNPIEVAAGYQRLIDECGMTQERVAERVGKDRATVANFLRLLRLPAQIQKSLIAGEISAGHARALLAVDNPGELLRLFEKVVKEKLSVRQVEQEVRRALNPTSKQSTQSKTEQPASINRERDDIILSDIIEKLKRHLGTQVKINYSDEKLGEIRIEFYGKEDLGRILDLIFGNQER